MREKYTLPASQHRVESLNENAPRPEFIRAVEIVYYSLKEAIDEHNKLIPRTIANPDLTGLSAPETALLVLTAIGSANAVSKKLSRRGVLTSSLGLVLASVVGCEDENSGRDTNIKPSGNSQIPSLTPTETPVIIKEDLLSGLKIPVMPNYNKLLTPSPTPEPTPLPTPLPTPEPTQEPEPQVVYEPPPEPVYETSSEVYPGGENKIILTFDDSGPQAYSILDIMAQYGAKGIFFPTGQFAASDPGAIQRMYNEGHLVCNHTYGHADLTTLSTDGIRYQILNGAGVGTCNLLRPPYGAHNGSVDSIAAELGYQIYMWDIDTRDWARRYPGGDQEILNIALSEAYPGAVILMHMHVDNTVYALPGIIEGLQAAGYTLSW